MLEMEIKMGSKMNLRKIREKIKIIE